LALVLVSGFLILGNKAWSQAASAKADSLRHLLKDAKTTSSQMMLHFQLAKALMSTQAQQALHHCKQGEAFAEQLADTTRWIMALKTKGELYAHLGESQKADSALQKGLLLCKKTGHELSESRILKELAQVAEKNGRYEESITLAFESLKIAQVLKDSLIMADNFNQIGGTYFYMGNVEKAEEYFQKAHDFYQKMDDRSGLANTLTNLGLIFFTQGEYDKSRENYRHSIQIKEELKDYIGLGSTYNNLGATYYEEDRYEEALRCMEKSLGYRRQVGHAYGIAESLLNLGALNTEIGEHKEAISFLEKALERARKAEAKELEVACLQALVDHYEAVENPKQAFTFQTELMDKKIALLEEESSTQIAQLESQFQLEEKKKEIEHLQEEQLLREKQAWREQLLRYGLIGALALALGLVIALVRQYRLLKQQNETLSTNIQQRIDTEKKLKILNEELSSFIYRSSHDLKSPLASVQGLVEMMKDQYDDPQLQQYFGIIVQRLVSLRSLVGSLLNAEKIKRMAPEIQAIPFVGLLSNMLDSLQNMEGFDEVKINCEVTEGSVFFSDQSVVGSVIQNLVTNAIKYRNPRVNQSFVNITVTTDRNQAMIRVEDNGIGIPEDKQQQVFDMFVRASGQSGGSGLGLYLVKRSVDQLKGEIQLDSEPEAGTTVVVTLPNTQFAEQKKQLVDLPQPAGDLSRSI
jgi:signal transduction histidine kinase